MLTGNGIGQNSGSFSIGAGNSDTENGGNVEFSGGNVTSATSNQSSGGEVSIFGGNTSSTNINAQGGAVFIVAGNAPIPANSGSVSIYDGNDLAGFNIGPNVGMNIFDDAGHQGASFLSTDRELDNAAGNPTLNFTTNLVLLATSPNVIQFQDGSQGTAGYVWTSTDTLGSGSWMPAPGGSAPIANTVFVNTAGDDTTCAIDSYGKPCATIGKAMSLIINPAVVSEIRIQSPGNYSVDGLVYKVNVFINGMDPVSTTLDFGNSGITMDSSWSNAGTNVGGITNCGLLTTGSISALTFDFSTQTNGEEFNFNNDQLPGNQPLNLLGINTGNTATFNITGVIQNKGALEITDAHALVAGYFNQNDGLNVKSTGTNDSIVYSTTSSYLGSVDIDGVSTGRAILLMLSGSIFGSLTLDTSTSLVQAQMGTLPSAAGITNTGGTLFYAGDAVQVPYFPATPGNWTPTVPTQVSQALDILAAASGGGGVPAGSNGNIQFNNSGAFGANTLLQWDNTNNNLGINQATPLARIHANSGTTSGSVGADAMILGKPDPTNNIGQGAFIEGGSNGTGNIASAQDAHAEGSRTQATSPSSHVEGFENTAGANYSHAEGFGSFTSGTAAHAEGESSANGNFSHSENSATANNANSHAEGSGQTNGNNAHAEGSGTNASGFSSHAEGQNTTASGTDSHSAGLGTTAQSDHQTAVGLYNTPVGTSGSPAATDEIFTVGNGASSGSTNSAFSIRRNGHLKSNQVTAPTTTVQSSAGTGASCAVSDATDSMGSVSITTGTVGASTGSYCNVNFNSSYSVAPICVLTPVTSNAATIVGPYVTSSTTAMTVNFAAAGGISTTYTLNYYCIETQ
jgi:hypothetical protein